jgi:hypothetical protein
VILPEFQEQPNGEISDPALSAAYDFKLYEHLLTVARRERRTRSAPALAIPEAKVEIQGYAVIGSK